MTRKFVKRSIFLNQRKETKNLEKRFEEMITRMDTLERNLNELKELKNTIRQLREANTSFNTELTKQKKEYLKSKTNSMK